MPPINMKPEGLTLPRTDVSNAPATKKVGQFEQALADKKNLVAKKQFRITNTGERRVDRSARPRFAEQIEQDKQKLATLLKGNAPTTEIVATALQNHPLLANLPNLKDLIKTVAVNIDPLVADMRGRKA